MASNPRLNKYLLGLDKAQVSPKDPKNQMLEIDIKYIVNQALNKVTEKDNRFKFKLNCSGSFYDGVKVGSPDEFDYVAEIISLQGKFIEFIPTEDPGFVQIKLNTDEQRTIWRDCLSNPEELRSSNATDQMYNWIETTQNSHYVYNIFNGCILLAPFKLQAKFKALIDEVMNTIDLPANWEHGGFQRPHYSGCRAHGPATMIMLVYRSQDEEIKINVDVTIGLAVPCPVDFTRDLHMTPFKNVTHKSTMEKIILNKMLYGPPIHLIPIYSKMLVNTSRYSNKFSFRISCSNIEKAILNAWPDQSGPKKCFRILKVIRDEYFIEGRRKTHRIKKKCKQREDQNVRNTAISDSKISGQPEKFDKQLLGARPKTKFLYNHENYSGKDNSEDEANINLPCVVQDNFTFERGDLAANIIDKENDFQLDCNHDETDQYQLLEIQGEQDAYFLHKVRPEAASNKLLKEQVVGLEFKQKTVTNAVTCQWDGAPLRIAQANYEENDTTDLTDVDDKTTKEYASFTFERKRHEYQTKDIEDMTCEPGCGEYYGPTAYMKSIEIKTFILKLLGTKWDLANWTDEKVCDYVLEFLQMYNDQLLMETMIRNCFIDTMVCSPINHDLRLMALEKYIMLLGDFEDIMEGID